MDRLRAEAIAARRRAELVVEAELREEVHRTMSDPATGDPEELPDERLRLVLLCAHPVLARPSAAALTLRLVLGVPTADLAGLFLVSVPTMAARLTRARKRLAGEAFALPSGAELERRVDLVAEVAYLAFTAGYAPPTGVEALRPDLAGEAIRLAGVVRELLPGRAELDALLALMMLQHSRRDARVDAGSLVLLPDQDRTRWHHDEIGEALALLRPWAAAPASPYLLQALIAAEHAVADASETTAWPRLADRYAELEQLTGSPVVRLNRAVAVAEADGPLAGLALLADLDLPGHRLPATRAELLRRSGRVAEARAAYDAAIAACANAAEARHLRDRRAAL